MKTFYGKYLANAFGVVSSAVEAMYLLLIFFAGVNTLLIPSVFLDGNVVNFQMITLTSQIMHIVSAAFLVLFYVKYFAKDNEDKTLKLLAIVFSLITVALTGLSYNIEHLFFLTTVNGVLLSVFLFVLAIADFYYINDRNHPLLKYIRAIMIISVVSAVLLVFSALTYYEITAAVMLKAWGRAMSVRNNYAISFIAYVLSCFLQIAEFVLLFVAEKMKRSKKEKKDVSYIE